MLELEEVKNALENLNDDLYWKLEHFIEYEQGSIEFSFRSNGNVLIVGFLGFDLWNSESDERCSICMDCNTKIEIYPCCNKDMKYEPLEDFLRREANRMIRTIERLHF